MRNRARATILSLLLAATCAAPAAAEASVTWVVHGAGFGHGVGMSAYGAYGYGKHGSGYRQIIHHYFRQHPDHDAAAGPLVRVLLDVSPGDVSFKHATAACGRQLEPVRSYRAHRRGSSVRLLSGSGKLLARCGVAPARRQRRPLKIGGVGAYRGALEVVPTERGGSLNVVNSLEVNDYVRGSVPAEVPPAWPAETLKAFAVAARSIALSTDVGGNGFDLYSDTRTQIYEGVEVETARTDRAVTATRNEVVTYHGEVAQTTYFSSSGGGPSRASSAARRCPTWRASRIPTTTTRRFIAGRCASPTRRWTPRLAPTSTATCAGSRSPSAATHRGSTTRS